MSLRSRLFARVYDRLVLPSEQACVRDWRAELLDDVEGVVVDIGAGTGANLPHFSAAVTRLIAAEPDPHMRRRLRERLSAGAPCPVDVVDAPAERTTLPAASVDAVVSTLVLCSVTDLDAALAEYRRVLRPGGKLVFIEHVIAHDNPGRARWQRRIEPIWKRMFGNCHLTRDTATAIERAGFQFESLERQSMRKASPVVRPTIRGIATH